LSPALRTYTFTARTIPACCPPLPYRSSQGIADVPPDCRFHVAVDTGRASGGAKRARFACAGAPFGVHGQAHGSHIQFSVVWKNATADCKAHSSWYGYVTGKTLATWWVQTSGVKRAAKKTRGTDTFVEQ
jgi:hypothetical protein